MCGMLQKSSKDNVSRQRDKSVIFRDCWEVEYNWHRGESARFNDMRVICEIDNAISVKCSDVRYSGESQRWLKFILWWIGRENKHWCNLSLNFAFKINY